MSHILPSSPIIEVASHLSAQQRAFLANGPKYVPICQSRFSRLPLDVFITREFTQLMESMKTGLTDHCVSASDQRAKEFFGALEALVRQHYQKPLPYRLQIRAKYDQRMVTSIRHILKKRNVIIRKTDKSKVFHLASADSYHQKSLDYMAKTKAYREMIDGTALLTEQISQVKALLDPMLRNKSINLKLWKSHLYPNPDQIELAHLYFIPKPHKVGTPLRPIVSSMKAAATGISHFLDQLLRPLFDRVSQDTSIINGIDFVRRLSACQQQGHLKPTTLFITFDVADLYTMIPRDGALIALEAFLVKHAQHSRIHGMTIDTLMKMARLVLDTNCFAFENRYYQQIRGGAMGSPFTMTLANIYMFKWEQPLIIHQKLHNEFYGRYIDDVFMTSNMALEEIHRFLDQADRYDENIHITRTIGRKIEFLDVSIENDRGQLKTTVHHKPAAEPYIVPFLSDHPRHIHRNAIIGALFRAIRLCSELDDFDKERLDIELLLLLNAYPPRFVQYHMNKFLQRYQAISLIHEPNPAVYNTIHHRLLYQPTRRERSLHRNLEFDGSPDGDILQRKIKVFLTFESGCTNLFKRRLSELWQHYYQYPGSPLKQVTLLLAMRSNPSLNRLLVHKKPPLQQLKVENFSTTN